MNYRIGIGYDSHRLVPGRKLVLGGVEVPFNKGLLGHSDADALLHAVCDALLGAAALGDIGEHFPDTDPKYRGISSLKLLKAVSGLLKKKHYQIINIDVVVILEQPKLSGLKDKMRSAICAALGVNKDRVGVKAKTNEGLGDIGKSKAIAAYAVALLKKTK